jgi:hypothetical protein
LPSITTAGTDRMPNSSARLRTRASIILCTVIWDEEPASRLTTSITSWQRAHPALNTSIFRFVSHRAHSCLGALGRELTPWRANSRVKFPSPRNRSHDRDVRLGSKADVKLLNCDVRFTPESGHSSTRSGCLLWAKSRPSAKHKTGADCGSAAP